MLEYSLEKTYHARGKPDFRIQMSDTMGEELTVLFGPSGAGKSSVLNLLAGIVSPDRGHILLGGETLFDSDQKIHVPIQRRKIGYLFQDLALFPHLTVAANIAYGMPDGAPRGERVRAFLEQFELVGQEEKYPPQLSGGQRQRVAIARTLAAEPRLLMLDEPLSALDEPMRERILWDILAIKEASRRIPILYVTHNLREAYSLADRVVVLDAGGVVEAGPREKVLARPARHRTAQCVGIENLFPCRVQTIEGGEMRVRLGGLDVVLPEDARFRPGDEAYLGVSPSDVRLVVGQDARENLFEAVITSRMERKNIDIIHLALGPSGHHFVMDIEKHLSQKWCLHPGLKVRIALPKEGVFLCQ